MKYSSLIIIIIMIIIGFADDTYSEHLHLEKWYQKQWCDHAGGQVEVVLPDQTRCDCLTTTHAIEFDFGSKWAEAIGQALYYSLQTGKKAGIVLILETPADYKYWIRLNSTIDYHELSIDAWKIGDAAESKNNTTTDNQNMVYITGKGKKYHRAGCRHLKDGGQPISLEEALQKGYSPCKVCNPPQ